MAVAVIPVSVISLFWLGAWATSYLPAPWSGLYIPVVVGITMVSTIVFLVRSHLRLNSFEGKPPLVLSSGLVKWLRTAAFVAVAVLVIGVLVFVLGPLANWTAPAAGLNAKERADAVTATRQVLLAAIAGTVVAAGLIPAVRTYLLSRRGQMTDRYSKAIALLASDKLTERMGGVFALELLMLESGHEHQTVSAVLAAFVRERAPLGAGNPPATPDTDVQAALSVLGRRPLRHEDNPIDLSRADLRGAVLKGARLIGADLSNCVLHGADLTDANLHSANLTGADLSSARLWYTSLIKADLVRCNARNSHLQTARLNGADLRGADFQHALFMVCDGRGYPATASFAGAKLIGGDWRGVSFAGCDLTGTVFDNTDLRGAAFLSAAELDEAALLRYSGHTRPSIDDRVRIMKMKGLDQAADAPTSLTSAQLSQARIDTTTQLPPALRTTTRPPP